MNNNADSVGHEGQLQELPNSTIILVLGILSVACLIGGALGIDNIAIGSIICGITGLVLAGRVRKSYKAAPESYTSESFRKFEIGRICSIIGLSIGGPLFLWAVIYYGILYTY